MPPFWKGSVERHRASMIFETQQQCVANTQLFTQNETLLETYMLSVSLRCFQASPFASNSISQLYREAYCVAKKTVRPSCWRCEIFASEGTRQSAMNMFLAEKCQNLSAHPDKTRTQPRLTCYISISCSREPSALLLTHRSVAGLERNGFALLGANFQWKLKILPYLQSLDRF